MRKGFAFLALVFVAATATAQVASFRAVLTGANETPTAADPDGLGNGYFTLDPTAGTVTFNLCFFNINAPTASKSRHGKGLRYEQLAQTRRTLSDRCRSRGSR